MTSTPYIRSASGGLYKYRRRTPSELKDYIGSTEIVRSLGKDQLEATLKATVLSQIISEAIKLTCISSVPSSVIQTLLDKHNLSCIYEPVADIKPTTLSQVVNLYLKQSQVTPVELSNRTHFFQVFLPAILQILLKKNDPDITELTYNVQLDIRSLFIKLPKRNLQIYRTDLSTLLHGVHKGTLSIPLDHRMALDTINKSLKRIKSLLIFCQNTSQITLHIPSMTIENKTQSRGQRKEFSKEELNQIDEVFLNDPIYPIVNILRYTGMRFSELLKCSLVEIEGVVYIGVSGHPYRETSGQ